MAKRVIPTAHRVVVYAPKPLGAATHAEMMRRSKELAEQVDRHCDGDGKAEVHFTNEAECDQCGREWTEKNDIYNACCTANVKEAEDAEFNFEANGF